MPEDKLRITEEFEVAAAAEPAREEKSAEPQEFVREVDLGDGSGKQRFVGKTYEELLDKFVQAQVNATRKIQELSRERKGVRQPEQRSSDWEEVKPQPVQLKPNEAEQMDFFRRAFQSEFGMSPQDFVVRENDRRRREAETRAANEFVRSHQDFYNSNENAQKIYRFLEAQNLPVSKRNLDYAYGELQGELSGRPSATPTPSAGPSPSAVVEEPKPASPERQVSPPPSFLRPSLGGRAQIDTGGGLDAAEVARIAQLPPAEMKARIEQLNRQSRGLVR